MPLTLKITSSQKDILGPDNIRVFEYGGEDSLAGDYDISRLDRRLFTDLTEHEHIR